VPLRPAVDRERHIERAQAARRGRIREAARALASEGGYAAVTMHDVAERAGVGRATVYRYYESKDHLIAEVHLEQSEHLVASLGADPLRGESAAARLIDLCGRIIDLAAQDLRLTEAGVTLVLSDDPAVTSAQQWQARIVLPYLDAALGPDLVVDRVAVAEVLQAVLFQALLGLAHGRVDPDEAKAALGRAVRLVLV
jgi:AcrR family transcriptional regulator